MSESENSPKFVFLLNVGLRSVERWLDSRGRPSMLSSAQTGTLFYLSRHDGALIGEVAQALMIKAPAMSGMANRMEQAGLIARRSDPLDGRATRLFMTEEGKLQSQHAKSNLPTLNAKLAEGFSSAEMDIVARWLESLQHKLEPDSGARSEQVTHSAS